MSSNCNADGATTFYRESLTQRQTALAAMTLIDDEMGLPDEPADCEPVAVMEDGWSEWLHPLPGFLMQCCDCGLVHEMQAAIGKDNGEGAALNDGERRNGRVVLFRMRRNGTPTARAMLNAAAADLLSACQAYASAYDEATGTIHVNAQIRAAIARATAQPITEKQATTKQGDEA